MAGKQIGDFAADHVPDDFGLVRLRGLERDDRRAVAQHGDAIADRKDFVEFVRDVDARDASTAQIAQDVEQDQDFVLGERGGRFVQDEDPGILRKRFDDLDELLLPDAELRHGQGGIDLDLELLQEQPRARDAPCASR